MEFYLNYGLYGLKKGFIRFKLLKFTSDLSIDHSMLLGEDFSIMKFEFKGGMKKLFMS